MDSLIVQLLVEDTLDLTSSPLYSQTLKQNKQTKTSTLEVFSFTIDLF